MEIKVANVASAVNINESMSHGLQSIEPDIKVGRFALRWWLINGYRACILAVIAIFHTLIFKYRQTCAYRLRGLE